MGVDADGTSTFNAGNLAAQLSTYPLADLANGTFKSPAFQTLYATLVATSRTSLVEALKVGARIEELDMRDITVQKAVETGP